MKYFVFSDVHGCLSGLLSALDEAGYESGNPAHHLLFLGDAFDKDGDERDDFGVYEFLKQGVESEKLTWVLGNHDVYLLNVLKSKTMNKFCKATIHNIALGLSGKPDLSDDECIEVLIKNDAKELIAMHGKDYFETEKYVFAHGFIPYNRHGRCYDENWRGASATVWNGCRSLNGQKLVLQGVRIPNKTLVCGHIGAYYGNLTLKYPNIAPDGKEFKKIAARMMRTAKANKDMFKTFVGDGVIAIDGRSFDTGMVNVLVVEGNPV